MLVVNSDKNEKKMPQNKNDFFLKFYLLKDNSEAALHHVAHGFVRKQGARRRKEKAT